MRVTRTHTHLLPELRANFPLVPAVSVVLQLLLVGMSGLLQGNQGPGQQLLVVPVPLLAGCSQLHLGEVMPVQGTLVLHLQDLLMRLKNKRHWCCARVPNRIIWLGGERMVEAGSGSV